VVVDLVRCSLSGVTVSVAVVTCVGIDVDVGELITGSEVTTTGIGSSFPHPAVSKIVIMAKIARDDREVLPVMKNRWNMGLKRFEFNSG